MRRINTGLVAGAVTLVSVSVLAQEARRPALAGRWEVNREASTAPGSGDVPRPDGPPDGGPPPGGRGGIGGGGGGGRGGFGGGGGIGGPGIGGGAARPSAEEMERRRALMQEVMQLPPRFTLAQKDDTISFIELDGVVRSYVANGKSEKHQLTNGIVETKTGWKGESLEMEVKVDRLTIRRTFAIGGTGSRQLEVTTTVDGGRRRAGSKTVFDESESQ